MDVVGASDSVFSVLQRYRVHILVFLIVLFIGLTFAHPELLLTDEWITVNQLHQLHDGHQVLVNEGKYGLYQNGTPNAYFAARGNQLAYSLFLPMISLPSLWLVDLFGDHFAFFVLYLWTFVLLIILLSLHFIFREYSFVGKWRWTPATTGAIFLLFFINLFYYSGFSVNDPNSFPEITAVVFTNIILLAFAGVLIYEINQTLFDEPAFSLFGTIACLFSSSYVLWATGCKDHILTMLLFVGVLLCMIKFQKTDDTWYLPLGFLIVGLLAWARPELALWVFFFVCCIWGYSFIRQLKKKQESGNILIICSPLFTVFGALPFFLNNYLITKNPLLPPNALYLSGESASIAIQASSQLQPGGDLPGASLYQILTLKNTIPSSNIPGDLFGILFHPLNGSMGIFSLTPLFLVMAVLAVVLVLLQKLQFSRDEIRTMAAIAFLAIPVFLAYANNLHQLNTSGGITPDIRYLSPLYVPLALLGLIIMRRIQVTRENPINILKMTLIICAFGLPLSLFFTAKAYADPQVAAQLDAPMSNAFSLGIFFLAILTLIILTRNSLSHRRDTLSAFLIASLCAAPFIWQIGNSVMFWLFSATRNGYQAWIPLTNILYTVFSFPLLGH
jgi:hypothetical protein